MSDPEERARRIARLKDILEANGLTPEDTPDPEWTVLEPLAPHEDGIWRVRVTSLTDDGVSHENAVLVLHDWPDAPTPGTDEL